MAKTIKLQLVSYQTLPAREWEVLEQTGSDAMTVRRLGGGGVYPNKIEKLKRQPDGSWANNRGTEYLEVANG